ncbi:aminoacyl-tRNA hydrolase [Spiroplasma turonicum]|uniref:Peptidyl-tRNA hydrolase n=1 Tax=Spiroplasma turonicum TaxID=216946 RepID=A0A0K1P7Y2_9MOLU|nr:aminoacyl-tRNA hydrolase [Spiroplasma turonicum]AKU80314.1 peptidyl-tRNA hydrolase [Spiroplasma turonicum]ALX71315.1 peptidyl-tRNA hydrolase [Spiroplasma turonicum]
MEKIIVGLGNPGTNYLRTRHNAGFIVIDYLLDKYGYEKQTNKFQSEIFISRINGKKIIFVKPQTYMNLSGEAIIRILKYFKLTYKELLIIHDDKDLNIKAFKFKQSGSSGGHNGLKNIIHHLGTEDFKRLRVGVGKPINNIKIIDWVLMKLNIDELNDIIGVLKSKDEFVIDFLNDIDFSKIMNKYN